MINKMEFYKEMYFSELERKDRIDSQISVVSTVVIGIVLAVLYILNYFVEHKEYDAMLLVYIFSFITVFVVCIATAFFIETFLGKDYKHTAYADLIENHHNELKSYFEQHQNGNADSELEKRLWSSFASCAGFNARQNDQKSKLLYNGRLWLAWSFLPFAFLLVVFAHHLGTRLSIFS